MNDLFLVVLIILACFGLTLYVLLRWWAKQKDTHHEKQLDLDDLLLHHGDDVQFGRETSFHFIEAAKWPI